MSDTGLFLLALVGLYLWECLFWVRRQTFLFSAPWLRRWKFRFAGTTLGNPSGALALTNPLPPLGLDLLSSGLPICFSAAGVYALELHSLSRAGRAPQSLIYVGYDEIRDVAVSGNTLWINGARFAKASSLEMARLLAANLLSLCPLPESQRPARILAMVGNSLDAEIVARRVAALKRESLTLRIVSNCLFVYIFVLGPLVVSMQGVARTWVPLLVGLSLLTAAVNVLFAFAHRRLYPENTEDRWTRIAEMALLPLAAIRAPSFLARPLVAQLHPLAVAKALCDELDFHSLAREVLLDLHYPAPTAAPSAAAAATEAWFRFNVRGAVEHWLHVHGVSAPVLLQPPVKESPDSLSFCPRCRSQYRIRLGRCEACGGLPLVAFIEA